MQREPSDAAGHSMNEFSQDKVVYDCNVYLQFLFNRSGPSGRCVCLALDGRVELFVSETVIAELRQLPEKQFCRREGITDSIVAEFIVELLPRTTYLSQVPVRFSHPVDPDDSAYVNLAIAAGAKLIVSRDKHLLNLTNVDKSWSLEFRQQYPGLRILQPPQFLAEWDARRSPSE